MTSSPTAPIDAFESILNARHSCRAFTSEPIALDIIRRILSAAQRTASWCNSQPWHVTITSGEATEQLRGALVNAVRAGVAAGPDFEFPRAYLGVYDERRKESGFQLYNALGIARGDKAAYRAQMLENFRFFGAPHLAIITTDEQLGIYGAVDCGGYVTNFVNAALAMGVAAIAQAALATQSAIIREHLRIPPGRKVVCGISFGRPDADHKANAFRTSRASLVDAAHFVG